MIKQRTVLELITLILIVWSGNIYIIFDNPKIYIRNWIRII